MEKRLFLVFVFYSLCLAVPPPAAAADRQTWKLRPGDNLDIIAITLDVPKEEIKKQNPGVSESNLQIGQQLRLPLRSYAESKALEEELAKKDARIGHLERKSSDLEKKIAGAESQLAWHPVWFWGFWMFFAVLGFITSVACWIFRQTHPRVFERPGERSLKDLRASQVRARSSFSYDQEDGSFLESQWRPSLKRAPAHR